MTYADVNVGLTRAEAIQAITIIGHRLDEVRNALLDTDYTKYGGGAAMGEQIRQSDQQYANDLRTLVHKLINAIDKQ